MEIREITNEHTWSSLFNQAGSPSFHHAWEWGEFQQDLGYDIIRLGLYKHEELLAVALVIKIRARRGNFLFVPHGPVAPEQDPHKLHRIFEFFVTHLKAIANEEKFSFIRIAPILPSTDENKLIFTKMGFRQAPIYMHAETMWALDITKSEDELLADMRKTTRYLIRKAIKEGVTIEKRDDEKVIDDFWEIYKETFTRENFTPFSKKFIAKEHKAFQKNDLTYCLFGRGPKNGKFDGHDKLARASALILCTQSTAFYHQGASVHSKLPIPYLLQWESILEAKRRGCKFYNFYGIMKPGRTPKAWAGLTLFKQGFGGFELDYVPTQDLVISPRYYLSYIYERILRFKRGV